MSDNLAPAYQLAYEEAVRGLSQQQSALDNFRTRAGILVSAAAIATSFLGGQALADRGFATWSWLAVTLFATVGASTLFIHDENERRLQQLIIALRWGSVLLAAEVIAWVVAIATSG